MSLEKTGMDHELLTWKDAIELEKYVYTAGVAGDIFLKKLKEKKITGAKCEKCGDIYVPPRLYCERCYVKTNFIELDQVEAFIDSITIIYKDKYGNKLENPIKLALLRFKGYKGGLLAIVEDEADIGERVEIISYEIPLRVRKK
ncbi:MAG: Zn-ribbon domain-containing OB-fold protein [Sulfolobaceae archaeon]